MLRCKVHIFWEGHKILRNLHRRFVLCSNGQIYGGCFAKMCGLLRIYELYYNVALHFWSWARAFMLFLYLLFFPLPGKYRTEAVLWNNLHDEIIIQLFWTSFEILKQMISWLLKFGLSEKYTKFKKISLMVLTNQQIYLVKVKTMRKTFSNYVCFSKCLNFIRNTIS